jgi:peptidyl-prolyl cis-trans isomerase B (cyclophilin B)
MRFPAPLTATVTAAVILLPPLLLTARIQAAASAPPVEKNGKKADKPKADKPKPDKKITRPLARIETTQGLIVIDLYPEEAPKTVANFITLAKKGFYNGLTFHRVEPGFVIQGGDPKGDGTGGPGYSIPNEPNKSLSHVRGAVGMANAGPDTAGSQFYIIITKPAPALDNGQYTVFGVVTQGQDVAEKIVKGDKMVKITIEVPKDFKIGPTRDAEPEFTVPVLLPESSGSGDFKSGIRVKVTVEPDGKTQVELTRKSGDKAVDEATLESLRAWKWNPALKNGEPVRSTVQFDYDIRTGSRSTKR